MKASMTVSMIPVSADCRTSLENGLLSLNRNRRNRLTELDSKKKTKPDRIDTFPTSTSPLDKMLVTDDATSVLNVANLFILHYSVKLCYKPTERSKNREQHEDRELRRRGWNYGAVLGELGPALAHCFQNG